jgi:hypothetical protein
LDWNEKILEHIDKDELRELCNPLEHFKVEEEESAYFIMFFY